MKTGAEIIAEELPTCRWFFDKKRGQKVYPRCGKPATWKLTNEHGDWHYCDEHHHIFVTEGDPNGVDADKWIPLQRAQPKDGE